MVISEKTVLLQIFGGVLSPRPPVVSILKTRGVVARPLTSDFVIPRKIFSGNNFFSEIISHLYVNV